MKGRLCNVFMLITMVGLVGACQPDSSTPAKKKVEDSDEKILAKIGDDAITLQRFKEFYNNLPAPYLQKYQGESGKRALLEQLVELKMFAQRARELGLDKDPENQRRIQETVERILAIAYRLKEIDEKITVTDEEVKNYYELHKEDYIRPVHLRVREIIVIDKKQADEILTLLRNGASFESLAKEHSVDRNSGVSGGDLGWIKRGDGIVEKPVEDLAFSLKKGEIGGPVKTRYGYHIIRVDDRLESYQRTLEEAYQPIKNKIRNIKTRELTAQVKAEAEKKLNVTVYWDLLKEIPDREVLQGGTLPVPQGSPAFPSAPSSVPDTKITEPGSPSPEEKPAP